MQRVIYTRPTYLLSGEKQNKAILEHFASEWDNLSPPKRYAEQRLKMCQFRAMIKRMRDGDVVFVYTPAVLGIGVEACVESIRDILAKGVRIVSVLYGVIDDACANHIEVAGNIVRDCCEIERVEERLHNRGLREAYGGYFEDGVWHEGQRKSYAPPYWAYRKSKYKVDKSKDRRESATVRWIDIKIAQGWTTERIWAEYQDLKRAMPKDMWESIGKQWINVRRLELIK